MNKLYVFFVFIFLVFISNAEAIESRDVHYGGSEYVDACGSYAVVDGFKKEGSFLSVREAPSLKSKEIDKLYKNQTVWVCEDTKDEKWLGIVYRKSSDGDIDCDVSSPQEERKAYKGPCRSGWVSEKYIKIVAG